MRFNAPPAPLQMRAHERHARSERQEQASRASACGRVAQPSEAHSTRNARRAFRTSREKFFFGDFRFSILMRLRIRFAIFATGKTAATIAHRRHRAAPAALFAAIHGEFSL
jgi:hypothetical protein